MDKILYSKILKGISRGIRESFDFNKKYQGNDDNINKGISNATKGLINSYLFKTTNISQVLQKKFNIFIKNTQDTHMPINDYCVLEQICHDNAGVSSQTEKRYIDLFSEHNWHILSLNLITLHYYVMQRKGSDNEYNFQKCLDELYSKPYNELKQNEKSYYTRLKNAYSNNYDKKALEVFFNTMQNVLKIDNYITFYNNKISLWPRYTIIRTSAVAISPDYGLMYIILPGKNHFQVSNLNINNYNMINPNDNAVLMVTYTGEVQYSFELTNKELSDASDEVKQINDSGKIINNILHEYKDYFKKPTQMTLKQEDNGDIEWVFKWDWPSKPFNIIPANIFEFYSSFIKNNFLKGKKLILPPENELSKKSKYYYVYRLDSKKFKDMYLQIEIYRFMPRGLKTYKDTIYYYDDKGKPHYKIKTEEKESYSGGVIKIILKNKD